MADELTQYGFTFGALDVSRTMRLPDGSTVVTVKTGHRELQIYGSPSGRSLRVFERGVGEYKPPADAVRNRSLHRKAMARARARES